MGWVLWGQTWVNAVRWGQWCGGYGVRWGWWGGGCGADSAPPTPRCPVGRRGRRCECEGPEAEEEVGGGCRPPNSTAPPCSGRGHCVCGACECPPGLSGRFCECDSSACERHEGLPCGGGCRGNTGDAVGGGAVPGVPIPWGGGPVLVVCPCGVPSPLHIPTGSHPCCVPMGPVRVLWVWSLSFGSCPHPLGPIPILRVPSLPLGICLCPCPLGPVPVPFPQIPSMCCGFGPHP